MRPVSDAFGVTQAFGSYATAGIAPDPNGTEVQQLVAAYGNYQPYGHAGCDIGCPIGTPVHAIASGAVLWADWGTNLPGDETDAGYRQRWYLYKTFPGIVVVIQHDGWIGVYAHLSETPLNPGDTVTEGQQIALSGNTRAPGVTLGAHLHVEALIDNSYPSGNGLIYGRADPTPYFGFGALTPQSIDTPQEDALTPEQMQELKQFIQEDAEARHLATRKAVIDGVYEFTTTLFKQYHAAALNELPAATLNKQFTLTGGTSTNLSGLLDQLHSRPSAGGAVVSGEDVAAAIADHLNIQITKK